MGRTMHIFLRKVNYRAVKKSRSYLSISVLQLCSSSLPFFEFSSFFYTFFTEIEGLEQRSGSGMGNCIECSYVSTFLSATHSASSSEGREHRELFMLSPCHHASMLPDHNSSFIDLFL